MKSKIKSRTDDLELLEGGFRFVIGIGGLWVEACFNMKVIEGVKAH